MLGCPGCQIRSPGSVCQPTPATGLAERLHLRDRHLTCYSGLGGVCRCRMYQIPWKFSLVRMQSFEGQGDFATGLQEGVARMS